jgi:hypothetical protein
MQKRKLSKLKDTQNGRLFNEDPADTVVIRTNLNGTRESYVPASDRAFRYRVTRMMIAAGIPMNTMNVIRPALEDMFQQPLAPPNMLVADYIQQILLQEVDTRLEELKGKQVSVCFDATPRMGDVFALIVRYVEITEEGKEGNIFGIVLGTARRCNSSLFSR